MAHSQAALEDTLLSLLPLLRESNLLDNVADAVFGSKRRRRVEQRPRYVERVLTVNKRGRRAFVGTGLGWRAPSVATADDCSPVLLVRGWCHAAPRRI